MSWDTEITQDTWFVWGWKLFCCWRVVSTLFTAAEKNEHFSSTSISTVVSVLAELCVPSSWPGSLEPWPLAPEWGPDCSAGSSCCSSRPWRRSPACPHESPPARPGDCTAHPVGGKHRSQVSYTYTHISCSQKLLIYKQTAAATLIYRTLCVSRYLCLVSFSDLHVHLDLSAKLLESFWPLLRFQVSLKNRLTELLIKGTTSGFSQRVFERCRHNAETRLIHRLMTTDQLLIIVILSFSYFKYWSINISLIFKHRKQLSNLTTLFLDPFFSYKNKRGNHSDHKMSSNINVKEF